MENATKYYRLLNDAAKMLSKRKLEKAYTIIQNARSVDSTKYEAYSLLGDYYGYKQEYEKSLKNHLMALAIEPKSAVTCHNIGLCMLLLGNKKEGINNLKMAINLDPILVESYRLIIPLLIEEERYVEADGYLFEALKYHPNDGTLNFLMANKIINRDKKTYILLSRTVLKYLDRAESKGVCSIAINRLRGDYYYQQQDWKNAEKYLRKSLITEYDEDTAILLATTLHELNLYDDLAEVLYAMSKQGSEIAKQLIDKYL